MPAAAASGPGTGEGTSGRQRRLSSLAEAGRTVSSSTVEQLLAVPKAAAADLETPAIPPLFQGCTPKNVPANGRRPELATFITSQATKQPPGSPGSCAAPAVTFSAAVLPFQTAAVTGMPQGSPSVASSLNDILNSAPHPSPLATALATTMAGPVAQPQPLRAGATGTDTNIVAKQGLEKPPRPSKPATAGAQASASQGLAGGRKRPEFKRPARLAGQQAQQRLSEGSMLGRKRAAQAGSNAVAGHKRQRGGSQPPTMRNLLIAAAKKSSDLQVCPLSTHPASSFAWRASLSTSAALRHYGRAPVRVRGEIVRDLQFRVSDQIPSL